MPWFSVEDDLAFHPKAQAAGNAALGLWVRAGSWSMKYLTDGHIPRPTAALLGSAVDVRRLVDAGLWVEVADGYVFHEWALRQRTRKKVAEDREKAAKKKATQRSRDEPQYPTDFTEEDQ